MGAQLRVYRQKIRSVQATKKITKAMELIASSRIVKAQQRVREANPYTEAIVQAISAAASRAHDDHPLLAQPDEESRRKPGRRAAMCLITADRGLAGGYSANAIREGEALTKNLRDEHGMEVLPFLIGRKALGFYKFRERHIAGEWSGFSEQPSFADAREVADALLEKFLLPHEEGGVDEIHLVYTHFQSLASQRPVTRRVLPLEVVEEVVETSKGADLPFPLYEFEPDANTVLDALLPRYVRNLVYTALLQSAASEIAARQRAMKSASDNAEELTKTYVRLANQARQAEITQEISEIVGGADALVSANA